MLLAFYLQWSLEMIFLEPYCFIRWNLWIDRWISGADFMEEACDAPAVERRRKFFIISYHVRVFKCWKNVRSNNFQTYFPAGIVLIGRGKGVSDTYEGIPLIPESEMTEWVCRNWVDEALIVLPQEQHFGKEYMEAFSEMEFRPLFYHAGFRWCGQSSDRRESMRISGTDIRDAAGQ